tara:strand:+ start:69 stop:710 length:642 start_codon:yes stop_codon:yes gene_type:complete
MIDAVNIDNPYVWKGHFDRPENYGEIKQNLSLIKDQCAGQLKSPLEEGNSFSTVGFDNYRPHKMEELASFYKQLYNDISFIHFNVNARTRVPNHMLTPVFDTGFHSVDTGSDKTNDKFFLIDRSWFNVHYNGARTAPHDHGIIDYVCAYYLNHPKDSGDFLIEPIEGKQPRTIPVETGDYLIFPGNVTHGCQQSDSDEERVVITTNIIVNKYD